MQKYLSEMTAGEQGIISSVQGGLGMQERLRRIGLVEGQTVRKVSTLAGRGPIIVLVNRTQIAIGRGMAHKIVVDM
jgi:ferrous iron transport protein A